MRKLFLSGIALLSLLTTPSAIAQDTIRLQFEVWRNGVLLGNPELSVSSGDPARLTIDGVGTIAVTASFKDSESVSLLFDISSAGRRLTPRMVIDRTHSGTAAWFSSDGADRFRLTFAWVR